MKTENRRTAARGKGKRKMVGRWGKEYPKNVYK